MAATPTLALDSFPLPPIRLERSGSHSSSSGSATSIDSPAELTQVASASDTPRELLVVVPATQPLQVAVQGSPDLLNASRSAKPEAGPAPSKTGFGLSLTKSVQNLRAKAKKDKEREKLAQQGRANAVGPSQQVTTAAAPPPVPPLPPQPQTVSSAMPSTVPSRPKVERASSSGFFSIFKKNKNKPAKEQPSSQQAVQPATVAHGQARQPARAPAQTVRSKPSLPSLQTAPQAAPRYPQPSTAPPSSQAPRLPLVRPTDPTRIPLPPSPNPEILDRSPFDGGPAAPSGPGRTAGGMLSLEGFEIDEQAAPARQQGSLRLPPGARPASQLSPPRPASQMPAPLRRPSQPDATAAPARDTTDEQRLTSSADEEDDSDGEEETDAVPDLARLRIPSSSGSVEKALVTPVSTTSKVGEVDSIVSPISIAASDSDLSEELAEMKAELESPNKRLSAVGDVGLNLGAREGKWRRSVMDFSSVNKRNSQRPSQRAPPTSYDAYLASQQRQASHRISAMPVEFDRRRAMASGVRVMAKQDKAVQQDMDTFFLS